MLMLLTVPDYSGLELHRSRAAAVFEQGLSLQRLPCGAAWYTADCSKRGSWMSHARIRDTLQSITSTSRDARRSK